MPSIKLIIILFAIVLLHACASSGPAIVFDDSFATEISADGTKFFTYTRKFDKNSESRSHHRGDKDGKSALQKSVQAKLDSSGYCRDDYLTLEDYEANGIARIRGECRDGANENDRTLFPNQH
jgi:hypothetical protein